ncbi:MULTISPECIES: AEC family transporter [Modicisalibacter]|uniref:AEC family transporter n=1 Tax=Modicisalibacter TaxID=574347 RepID=UPI00100B7346|nr:MULTISPECIES: AEC family transporter [Halomonadaceae]MBZ9558328.1 AEC family transporter [Modicisalibacter sp. R2A 31.J]MBZ9575780.1 AEC family transporter [Modicisalibacter sp. MOD 31.J]
MSHDLYQPLWTLLAFVALGWLCARRLAVDPRPIATLLIYVIAPLTFFRGLVQGHPGLDDLALTAALFLLASTLALLVGQLAKRVFAPPEAAVLAFSAGTGNTGYFGLPLAMVLLPPEGVAQYLFCLLGITLYEFTVGYFLSARGRFSMRASLARIVRLPLIYAFAAALAVNALGLTLPGALMDGLDDFTYCYTVLGMMIIGMTLGRVTLREVDVRFITACVLARFALWPLISLLAVWALQATLAIDATLATALLLIGVVPMAANVVVIAMELDTQPAKGAIAVMLTTLAAPLVVPPYLGALQALAGLG